MCRSIDLKEKIMSMSGLSEKVHFWVSKAFLRPVLTAILFTSLLISSLPGNSSGIVRIKDIASIGGLENKQLIGYGLVVGLNGTGDGTKSAFTVNSIVSMLEKMGITVSPSEIKVKNVAAVIVTAELPPFTPEGSRIDVTVSSLGDASSLEGGQLLMTPMKGADGVTYAVAQGPVSIGGFNIDAGAGNVTRKNHATVGRIPEGAIVRRSTDKNEMNGDQFTLVLDDPDYQSVTNIANQINFKYKMMIARALNSRLVRVKVPPQYRRNPVEFIAEVGQMRVAVDSHARVVINERTGTIVVGGDVLIDEVAIAHGNLKIEIKANYAVSQPMAFAGGESVIVPEIETVVEDKEARFFAVRPSNTVGDIASALNELGVTPRDMIAIFQALKKAGALKADLIIM